MKLVIVESPAKSRTIQKYLGADYKILASFGHIRDLPAKSGSVEPENAFHMHWDINPESKKHMQEIRKALKEADTLILATDPDREGEAISWHILEFLKQKKALKGKSVERVVFNSITKKAILEAIAHPRQIDGDLVDAYLARRALDYLVGFTLSPLLWRKLPGARSAGRVQSVVLRLICAREHKIDLFQPQEYWSLTAQLQTQDKKEFLARLIGMDGAKLDRFDIATQTQAQEVKDKLEESTFRVLDVQKKPQRRSPPPPFTTSTLQQEASRQFGFSAAHTMRVAQKLYEGIAVGGETTGLITYMRTDAVQIVPEAIQEARSIIQARYGSAYLPKEPRHYATKAKNTQEAHEAIRPTSFLRHPDDLASYLDADQKRLYDLIWRRAVASQMENARLELTRIDSEATKGKQVFLLRSTGSVLLFDGYLRLYQEKKDDEKEEVHQSLPPVSPGASLVKKEIIDKQHFTESPPRYTEASLVKQMEELGIGRPSTYSSTLHTLQNRNYVRLEKKRFVPEDRGRVVTAFLESFFNQYVEYDFTAELEEKLDRISSGDLSWKEVLTDFWTHFHAEIKKMDQFRIADVIDVLNDALASYLFPPLETEGDPKENLNPRQCPACGKGHLSLKVSKYGAFIGCSAYPECQYVRQLPSSATPDKGASPDQNVPRTLGKAPESDEDITLRSGRFGPYVQIGEGKKPKRASLPPQWTLDTVTLEKAIALLSLPREIGMHPETHLPITAGIGRYGAYLYYKKQYRRLEPLEAVFTLTLDDAVERLAQPVQHRGRQAAAPLRALGDHPLLEKPIDVYKGRYGPYVKCGKINATLPKSLDPEHVSLEEAIALIDAKAGH